VKLVKPLPNNALNALPTENPSPLVTARTVTTMSIT
jgi:hypothetical protein